MNTKHIFFRMVPAVMIVLLGFVMLPGQLSAQTTEPETEETETTEPQASKKQENTPPDTTEISFGNRKVIIISNQGGKEVKVEENEEGAEGDTVVVIRDEDEDDDFFDPDYHEKRKRERRGSYVGGVAFDLGVTNYWADGTYGADAAAPSLQVKDFRPGAHVALHLLPTRVTLIGKGHVNLKSALTIDWANYYFTNPITLAPRMDSLSISTNNEVEYSRNKLTSRYFQIPLLLNFNTAPGDKNGVSISVGGYAGVLWQAWTKQKSESEGKLKVKDDFNLNPFRYGLTARVDFRWFDFYLNYNLSEMFEEGQGPATQTFSAGINFIDF